MKWFWVIVIILLIAANNHRRQEEEEYQRQAQEVHEATMRAYDEMDEAQAQWCEENPDDPDCVMTPEEGQRLAEFAKARFYKGR